MTQFKKIISIYKNSNIVFKASIWFLCVTIIDKSIAILTQPIINRILSVEEVGVFGVYNSWKAIFSVFATFNLFGGVLEVYLIKESEKKRIVISSLCSLSIIISLVFWIIFFCFGDFFSSLLKLKKIYLLFMSLTITSEAIIQFWAVPKRFEYSYKIYTFVIVGLFVIKSVLSVLLTYLYTRDRILGRILGLLLPEMCVASVLLIQILKMCDKKIITSYWKIGLFFNLPLIPHYLSSIFLASSDKVMIQQLIGDADTGKYTIAYSFSSLTLIVFNALNSSYTPLSMKAMKEKNYKILSNMTEVVVVFSVIFSIFMMLLAPEGLFILGGIEYLTTLNIVPILIIGIFFSSFYFIFSNVEFVYEKNKMIFPITFIGALINIGLNYFFLKKLGYEVAAYTTFIGYLFIALSHYIISRQILGKDIYNINKIILYILLLFIGCIVSLILYQMNSIIRYIFIIILLDIIVYLFYKNKSLFKK